MATIHKAVPGLTTEAALNPQTGRPWSLADRQFVAKSTKGIAAMKKKPELAEQFLKDLGVLTKGGKLSKKYGG